MAMAAAGEDLVEIIKLVGGPSAVIALGGTARGRFRQIDALSAIVRMMTIPTVPRLTAPSSCATAKLWAIKLNISRNCSSNSKRLRKPRLQPPKRFAPQDWPSPL